MCGEIQTCSPGHLACNACFKRTVLTSSVQPVQSTVLTTKLLLGLKLCESARAPPADKPSLQIFFSCFRSTEDVPVDNLAWSDEEEVVDLVRCK